MITGTMKMLALTILTLGFAAVPSLRAGSSGSMSVSPSVVMLRGEVGQSTTQTLSFTNDTSQALSFEMKALDAVVRDGTRLYVEAGTHAGGIAATAVFTPSVFTVASAQSIDIKVTVTIPPRPAVRAIAVMCQGTTKLGTGPVKMTTSIGTLVTFALSGDVIAADATPLTVRPPTPSSTLLAAQQLSNSGTEPVVIAGMLAIVDGDGAMVGRQAIPPRRLLPGETSDVRVEFGGDLASGRYKALVTYDIIDGILSYSEEFDVI